MNCQACHRPGRIPCRYCGAVSFCSPSHAKAHGQEECSRMQKQMRDSDLVLAHPFLPWADTLRQQPGAVCDMLSAQGLHKQGAWGTLCNCDNDGTLPDNPHVRPPSLHLGPQLDQGSHTSQPHCSSVPWAGHRVSPTAAHLDADRNWRRVVSEGWEALYEQLAIPPASLAALVLHFPATVAAALAAADDCLRGALLQGTALEQQAPVDGSGFPGGDAHRMREVHQHRTQRQQQQQQPCSGQERSIPSDVQGPQHGSCDTHTKQPEHNRCRGPELQEPGDAAAVGSPSGFKPLHILYLGPQVELRALELFTYLHPIPGVTPGKPHSSEVAITHPHQQESDPTPAAKRARTRHDACQQRESSQQHMPPSQGLAGSGEQMQAEQHSVHDQHEHQQEQQGRQHRQSGSSAAQRQQQLVFLHFVGPDVPPNWHGKCLELPHPCDTATANRGSQDGAEQGSCDGAGCAGSGSATRSASSTVSSASSSASNFCLTATFWSGALHEVEEDLQQWLQEYAGRKHASAAAVHHQCASCPSSGCTPPPDACALAATPDVQHRSNNGQHTAPGGCDGQHHTSACQDAAPVVVNTQPFAGDLLHAHNCVLIAPNAGLPVYPSWLPTLGRLNQGCSAAATTASFTSTHGKLSSTISTSNRVQSGSGRDLANQLHPDSAGGRKDPLPGPPCLVITDYAEEAIHMSKAMIAAVAPNLECVLGPVVNPARQPIPQQGHGNKLPAASNAFTAAFACRRS